MLISRCHHNKRQCRKTSELRRANTNSWQKACPRELNIFIRKENTSQFVYELAEIFKVKKKL